MWGRVWFKQEKGARILLVPPTHPSTPPSQCHFPYCPFSWLQYKALDLTYCGSLHLCHQVVLFSLLGHTVERKEGRQRERTRCEEVEMLLYSLWQRLCPALYEHYFTQKLSYGIGFIPLTAMWKSKLLEETFLPYTLLKLHYTLSYWSDKNPGLMDFYRQLHY